MDDDLCIMIPVRHVEDLKKILIRIMVEHGDDKIIPVCILLFDRSFSERFKNILRYKPLSSGEWDVVRKCFNLLIPDSITLDDVVQGLHQFVGPYLPKVPDSTAVASAEDLLSAYVSNGQSSSLSRDLIDCSRFLVPLVSALCSQYELSLDYMYKLILNPPWSVKNIARIAKENKGSADFIESLLDPTLLQVPTIEGLEGNKLTKHPQGRSFGFETGTLNYYLEDLFEIIAYLGSDIGIDVRLNRFDLFHGHMFVSKDGRLGILFHAREFPAEDDNFPVNLGDCQIGSTVKYDDAMNLRNILWLAPVLGDGDSSNEIPAPGVLVSLDAHPSGIIYGDIVSDDDSIKLARTIYEGDFGKHACDVNYLNVGTEEEPDYQIFICTKVNMDEKK